MRPDARRSGAILSWVALIGLARRRSSCSGCSAPVLTPFVIAAVLAYALHPAGRAARGAPRAARCSRCSLVEVAALVALAGAGAADRADPVEGAAAAARAAAAAGRADQPRVSPWLAQMGIHVVARHRAASRPSCSSTSTPTGTTGSPPR